MQPLARLRANLLLLPLALAAILPLWFRRTRARFFPHGKELGRYRNELSERTQRIEQVLADVAGAVDALRRRDMEVDDALPILSAAEEQLDREADEMREMLAPEELHGLHMEYEANLERALRGIVTAERGCAITRLPHRPPDDEEPFTYYKRGHANVVNARLRLQEAREVMLAWAPGKPADLSVATRLARDEE